jgi:transposase
MLSNYLHSKEHENVFNPNLKKSIRKEMEHLVQIEETLEKEMKAFAENNLKIREELSNLISIKGIGVIYAIALLYLFRKYSDANRNEITALAGSDPVKRQSGSSLNGGRKISKDSNSLLRKILYLSCMSGIQHNDRIRVFYENLITNHKKPKVVLVACMKKLLLTPSYLPSLRIIAHQVYVNKSEYKSLYIDDKNICPSS